MDLEALYKPRCDFVFEFFLSLDLANKLNNSLCMHKSSFLLKSLSIKCWLKSCQLYMVYRVHRSALGHIIFQLTNRNTHFIFEIENNGKAT